MNRTKIWLLILTLLTLLALSACGGAKEAQGEPENVPAFEEALNSMEGSTGVVLVPVEFRDNRWILGESGIQVLPCAPPSPFQIGEVNGPLIQVMGSDNQVVYDMQLPMDPRILVYEGPSETPNILEEVSIVLKLPLLPDMQSMEFYLTSSDVAEGSEQKPVLEVDLSDAVLRYEEMGAMEQSAECQEPVYQPDALKP